MRRFAHPHPSFPLRTVASFHWLGFLHYYGTSRHLAGLRSGFPFQVIPFLPLCHLAQGTYKTSPGHHAYFSVHPDPNHVDASHRSFPFPVCL